MTEIDEELDEELRAYLRETKSDRTAARAREDRREKTLERITNQLVLIDKKFDMHTLEDRNAFAGVHARLGKIEERDEITDRHNIEELQRQLAEKRAAEAESVKVTKENRKHYTRLAIYFIATILGSGSAGAAVHHFLTQVAGH